MIMRKVGGKWSNYISTSLILLAWLILDLSLRCFYDSRDVPIYPPDKDIPESLHIPHPWTCKKPVERRQRHLRHLYLVLPRDMSFTVIFWQHVSTMNLMMSRLQSVTGSMYLLSCVQA